MPYVRCGKCVYKGERCNIKGKKVGCSDTIEKAKKHLRALHANVHETKSKNIMKITKKQLIALIKEQLEVVLTDDEAKEMFDIEVEEETSLAEGAPLDQTAPMDALKRTPTVSEPSLSRAKAEQEWRKMVTDLVESLVERVAILEDKINLL